MGGLVTDASFGGGAIGPPPLRAIDEFGRPLPSSAGLVAAERRVFDTVAAVAVVIDATGAVVVRVVVTGTEVTGVRSWAERWARRGRALQRRSEEAALRRLRAVRRAVVTQLIEDVDVNAVLARVDIDAVLTRIDVAGVAQRVLDDVDVGRLVRESSSTLATETADAVRAQGKSADRALSHLFDRVFRRGEERQIDLDEGLPALLSGPEAVTSSGSDDAGGEMNGGG